MIEQFYPWYWKFYDMAAEDEGGNDGDSDAEDTDDTDDTGEGEAGEDAPPSEDAPSGGCLLYTSPSPRD